MNNPKISVIVPIYNCEKYIRKCLDSIVNQTFKELEIILIDDCGQDNSFKIAEEYAQKDERIILIRNKKNMGQGYSRNYGVKIARSEYIAYVDSDDFLDVTMYEKVYKKAKEQNSDIVKCQFYNYTQKSILKDGFALNIDFDNYIYNNKQYGLAILGYYHIAIWNGIYRKEFLEKNNIKFDRHLRYEDTLYQWQTFILAKRVSFISDCLYYYNKENMISDTAKLKGYYRKVFENIILIKKFTDKHNLGEKLSNHLILRFHTLYRFLRTVNLKWYQKIEINYFFKNILKDTDKSNIQEISQQFLESAMEIENFIKGYNPRIKHLIMAIKNNK